MRCATVLSLAACVAVATAAESTTDPRSVLFVEGSSTGLVVDIDNVAQCTQNVAISLAAMDAFVPAVKAAKSQANAELFRAQVPLFGAAAEEISHAFTVCGAFKAAEEVDMIAQALQASDADTEFFAELLAGDVADDDLSAVVQYFEAGDFFSLGVHFGRLVSLFIERGSTQASSLSSRAFSYMTSS